MADLPDDLVRLWRLPTGSGLGRPAALDTDRVVRTAVELADQSGLTGATLPKIAERLGVTPMSLYRYIGSKDELLVLMGDMAFVPDIGHAPRSWRAGLHGWAAGLWRAYRAHPWLAELPVSGPPRGPNAIAWMDAGLRAMRDIGLDRMTKVGILTLLGGYVNMAARMAQQLEQGWRAGGAVDPAGAAADYGREMNALIEPSRFPDAAELFSSGVFGSSAAPATRAPADPAEANFVFGLEVILDGVESMVSGER
ncbi:TetR/AcrR family transcriptional regulator [Nocardia arthritidis]|uniref:TetR family transcriptional regulator n=1 Tax=Nocardia arthritidis TaxID=228602 RepID=A0A6G9YIQ1_9NOCA|nr:TetR/AcrR family transcriptional regulator [Nocardia arthritidis]QIS13064.1 TetR family transcriptional regulator [Nocardia arthritidis]